MTHPRTALVIGGGIAGPAAAIALQKAGIDAVIYEAHPGSAEGIGSFLTLGSNGIDALRTIDAEGAALAAGFPTPGITLRGHTGKQLGVSRISTSLTGGTTSHTLKRSDLYQVMHDEATSRGIRFEHGKCLTGAMETGDGVRAIFADGSEASGDLLIGGDGVHSAVRTIIDPNAPAPTYAGLINLGGYVRAAQVEAEPGSYTMIFGKRAFFGYAVAPDGEVWWFANLPRRDEPARGELASMDAEEWRRRLIGLYGDDAGPAVRILEATPNAGIGGASPIHLIPHLPAWHRGRMVVIGDSAHAPSPSSGQGASLSIEDAVVLAKCLRDLPDHRQAFTRFEALRRPRVERIIKAAARINNSKAAGPVGRVVRDAVLPLIMKMAAGSKQVQEVYAYHIDWDAPITGPQRPGVPVAA
jgi:2-polyprenyl-6-methoxyphenol hydroxylase-like FAD-dependent oxidoreductase